MIVAVVPHYQLSPPETVALTFPNLAKRDFEKPKAFPLNHPKGKRMAPRSNTDTSFLPATAVVQPAVDCELKSGAIASDD
jgi:hypothetical protein